MDERGLSRSSIAMADAENPTRDDKHTEAWRDKPWKHFQRVVCRLQKRIYRAQQRHDRRMVHKLQRLLLTSQAARHLAVRRVTQDNQGKRTAGVDGVASLRPPERLQLAMALRDLSGKADPIRRVYIPKPGRQEQRPLGIPIWHSYCTFIQQSFGLSSPISYADMRSHLIHALHSNTPRS